MTPPDTAARGGPNGYPNPCPVCGVRPFQRCRSLTKGKLTDTHAARVRGEWPDRDLNHA